MRGEHKRQRRAAPAVPSLSPEGMHGGLGGSPGQIPSSVYLQPPPAPPRPHLEEGSSAPCDRTLPSCLEYCPQRSSPTICPTEVGFSHFPQQCPASAGGDLAPGASLHPPTISAQVPDTQGLVSRG